MIKKTFVKEIKEMVRDGRVRILFFTVAALLTVTLWIRTDHYEKMNAQYETASVTERQVWDNQGEKNPHSASHFGTYAFKPKYPLSLIDQGVDKYMGTSIFLESHKRNEAQFSAAGDQTGQARFGELSPDFILLFIVPLFIIFLGFNSVTKEVEIGTLTVLKSHGIAPFRWMMGKWLALFLPIFLLTFALFLIAGIVLANLDNFGVFRWSSLIWLGFVYTLYYIVFINIVLFISVKSNNSGRALVLSLTVWILSSLVAPKVASNMASFRFPYPTKQEFDAMVTKDKKNGIDGHNPWSDEVKQLEKNILKEYQVDSLHQLPFNFAAYRTQKAEEYEAEVYFKHYKYLKEQFNQQTQVYKGLAIISPYLPTRFLSMAISNTDYATHLDFSDAAENYRILMQKFLNDNTAQNTTFGQRGYKADAGFWKQLPPFEYDPPELKTLLNQNTVNFAVLGGWLCLSFGLFLFTAKAI